MLRQADRLADELDALPSADLHGAPQAAVEQVRSHISSARAIALAGPTAGWPALKS